MGAPTAVRSVDPAAVPDPAAGAAPIEVPLEGVDAPPSGGPGLRVVLVDDLAHVRMLIASLLAEYLGIEVVGEAADSRQAIEVVERTQPDLVVLDLTLPAQDGVATLPELQRVAPDTRVVDPGAMRAGAAAYVEDSAEAAHRLVPDLLARAGLLHALAGLDAGAERHIDRELPADPSSPGRARRLVRRALWDQEPELLDTVELLVSELVTNAVVHAQTAAVVGISLFRDRVHVEVRDTSTDEPRVRQATEEDESGRGLTLVEALSNAWGITRLPEGKAFWFDVAR